MYDLLRREMNTICDVLVRCRHVTEEILQLCSRLKPVYIMRVLDCVDGLVTVFIRSVVSSARRSTHCKNIDSEETEPDGRQKDITYTRSNAVEVLSAFSLGEEPRGSQGRF